MGQTGLIADQRVRDHFGGPGHPEQPARFTAIYDRLEAEGLLDRLQHVVSRAATDDDLALAHSRDYIALAKREVAGRPPGIEHRRYGH